MYTAADGVVIERHVSALPLSREAEHLPALRNSLAVYRMVFGQPRQQDLVSYLQERLSSEEITRNLERLRIDLSPPSVDLLADGFGPSDAEATAEFEDPEESSPAEEFLSAE